MDPLTRLLQEARLGDSRSLEAFVFQTQQSVRRFCAHLAGPDNADDATQETYLAAWRALPAFRAEASARTWLFVIARRTAEQTARRHRRWNELAQHIPDPTGSPKPDGATDLQDLLARIEPDRRVALVLTQLLGFSYAEAAEVCQCPVGTIRSRVARAREDLVASMSDHTSERRNRRPCFGEH
jgi:RNA polymerase sigma-70 factor (ECF subfamily)